MPNLEQELSGLFYPKQNQLKGSLGISESVVEVSTRPGYVWVRLLDNPSELIKVRNTKVSPLYNLPVIVKFNGKGYEIIEVDSSRYAVWNSSSSYLPNHGPQHSAIRGAEGSDIVWVDGQQFLPLLVMPVESTGTPGVIVNPYNYRNSNDEWFAVSSSGTFFLPPLTVTGSNIYLMMLDDTNGEFFAITGSWMSSDVTGTQGILNNIPDITNYPLDIPLAVVKVTSGVSLGWHDIYDVRQFYSNNSGGSASGTADTYEQITLAADKAVSTIEDVGLSITKTLVSGTWYRWTFDYVGTKTTTGTLTIYITDNSNNVLQTRFVSVNGGYGAHGKVFLTEQGSGVSITRKVRAKCDIGSFNFDVGTGQIITFDVETCG